MSNQSNRVDLTDPYQEFGNHLKSPDNQRIFFSGRFGTGKTYFLKHFFDQNKEGYAYLHLYPVNYSIAATADIFELIKHDILFELLKKYPDFFEVESLTLPNKIYAFLQQPFFESLLTAFSSKIAALNKEEPVLTLLGTFTNEIAKFADRMRQFGKQLEGKLSELNLTKEYHESISNSIGGIYESDIVTELITNIIDRLKKNEKKVVLVVDDLDRIDPEHLFRILNIFSAHFDKNGLDNKFGLDSVVLVAHYENVASIFSHRYGLTTDFDGYMDKFFSTSVFRFDNSDAVLHWFDKSWNRTTYPISRELMNATVPILISLVTVNHLSIRKLMRLDDDYFINIASKFFRKRGKPLRFAFDVLSHLFPKNYDLESSLESAANTAHEFSFSKEDYINKFIIPEFEGLLKARSIRPEGLSKIGLELVNDEIKKIKIKDEKKIMEMILTIFRCYISPTAVF